MIWLTYDGSAGGDWLARYAVQLARHTPERCLRLVHVASPADRSSLTEEALAGRVAALAEHAGGVEIRADRLAVRGDMCATLESHLPRGPEHVILCGMRLRPGARGVLRGTVSERLLHHHGLQVLAVRIVKPGLLGAPHRLLLPLAGHPRGLRVVWAFLSLLLPSAAELTLLRVVPVPEVWILKSSFAEEARRKEAARVYLHGVAGELRQRWPTPLRVDERVRCATDWEREILAQAGSLSAELILLGASERGLLARSSAGRIDSILRHSPCDVAIYRGR